MKLYTITATPVMNETQAAKFPAFTGDIKAFNNSNLKDFEQSVAGTLANFGIDGFTIYQVKGYWKSEQETSYKIEIALDDSTNDSGAGARATAEMVAQELATVYNQEAVMLTLPNNEVLFIEQ